MTGAGAAAVAAASAAAIDATTTCVVVKTVAAAEAAAPAAAPAPVMFFIKWMTPDPLVTRPPSVTSQVLSVFRRWDNWFFKDWFFKKAYRYQASISKHLETPRNVLAPRRFETFRDVSRCSLGIDKLF